MGPTVLFVYDRSQRSVRALTALVRAVAQAEMEGMFVEVERDHATDVTVGPIPSVRVDGVESPGTDATSIYEAIARAYRRPVPERATLPRARVR